MIPEELLHERRVVTPQYSRFEQLLRESDGTLPINTGMKIFKPNKSRVVEVRVSGQGMNTQNSFIIVQAQDHNDVWTSFNIWPTGIGVASGSRNVNYRFEQSSDAVGPDNPDGKIKVGGRSEETSPSLSVNEILTALKDL